MDAIVNPKIEEYCAQHTTPLPPIFDELRQKTYASMTAPHMQVGLIEGSFLKLLVALSGAKTVLEFGTFTGFSALAMAQALPVNGKIITCDVDPKATAMAKEFWLKDPQGKKIELRLAPGLDTVSQLEEEIDLVFIDADKANYRNYWDASLPKVRRNGLIVVDNVLWSGKVLNPQEASDKHIVQFNDHAFKDKRVETLMLPIRDGMLLARKL